MKLEKYLTEDRFRKSSGAEQDRQAMKVLNLLEKAAMEGAKLVFPSRASQSDFRDRIMDALKHLKSEFGIK